MDKLNCKDDLPSDFLRSITMPKNWQQVEELKTLKNKLQQKIKQNISSIQSTKVNHERKSEVALSTIDVTDSQNECLTNVPSKSNLAIHTEKTKTGKQDIKLDNHCHSAVHVSLIADRGNHGFNNIPEKLDVKSSVGIGLNTNNDLSVLSSERPYVYTPKCQNVLNRSSQHSKMEEHKYKEKNKVTLSKKKEINTSYNENRNKDSEMIIKRLCLDNDSQLNFQNQYINFSSAKLKSNQNSSNPGIKRCKSDTQTLLTMKDKNKKQYTRSTKTQIYSKKTYNLSRPQMSKTLNHIKEGEISQENELLKAKMLCCSKKILLNKHRLLKNKWELEMKRHCLSDSSAFSVYKLKQKAFEKQSHLYKLNKIPVSGFSSYHENKSKPSNSEQAKRAYTTSVSAKQSKNKRKMDCLRTKTYALAHPSSQVDTAAFQDGSQTIPSLFGPPVNPAFSNDSYKVLSKKTDDSSLTTEFVWSTSNSVQCTLQSSVTAVILPSLTPKSMTETSIVSVACSMVLVPCFAASSSLPTVHPSSVSSSTATVQTGINIASQEFGINTRADNYNSTSLSTAGYKYSGNNMVVSALTLPNGQLFTKSPTSTCFRPLLQNINGSLMPVYDQSKPNSSVAGIHPAIYLLPGTANTELRDLNQNQLKTKGGHVRQPANTILSAGSTTMRSLLKSSTSSLERQKPSAAISSTTINSAAINTDSTSTTKVSCTQLNFSKALTQYTNLNIRTCAKPVGNKHSLVSSSGNKTRQGLILGTDQKKTSPTIPTSVSEKETSMSSSNFITKIKLSKHSLMSSNGNKTRQGFISGTDQKNTSPTIPPSMSVNETSVSSSKFITNSRQSENQFTSDRTNKHSLMSSNSNKTRQCLVLGIDQKKMSPTIALKSVALNETSVPSTNFITNIGQSENQFTSDSSNTCKHSLVSSNGNKTGQGLILGIDHKKMSPTIPLPSMSVKETSVSYPNFIQNIRQSENQFANDSTSNHSYISSYGNKTRQCLILDTDQKKILPTISLSVSVKETSVSSPNYIPKIRQSESHSLVSSNGTKTRQELTSGTDQKKMPPTIPPSVSVKETFAPSPNLIPFTNDSTNRHNQNSTSVATLPDDESNLELFEQFKVKPSTYKDDRQAHLTASTASLAWHANEAMEGVKLQTNEAKQGVIKCSEDNLPKIEHCFSLSRTVYENMDVTQTNGTALVSSGNIETSELSLSTSTQCPSYTGNGISEKAEDQSSQIQVPASNVALLSSQHLNENEILNYLRSSYNEKSKLILLTGNICDKWERIKQTVGASQLSDPVFLDSLLQAAEQMNSKSAISLDVQHRPGKENAVYLDVNNTPGTEYVVNLDVDHRPGTENAVYLDVNNTPGTENAVNLDVDHRPGTENAFYLDVNNTPGTENAVNLDVDHRPGTENAVYLDVGSTLGTENAVYLDNTLGTENAAYLDVDNTLGRDNAAHLDVDHRPGTDNAVYLDMDHRPGTENAVYLDMDHRPGTENAVYLDVDSTLGTENAVYLDNTLGTENAAYLDVDNTLGRDNAAHLDVDHRPGTDNAVYLDMDHRPDTENAAYLNMDYTVPEIGANIAVDQTQASTLHSTEPGTCDMSELPCDSDTETVSAPGSVIIIDSDDNDSQHLEDLDELELDENNNNVVHTENEQNEIKQRMGSKRPATENIESFLREHNLAVKKRAAVEVGQVQAEASTVSNLSVATVNLDGSIAEIEEKTVRGQKIQPCLSISSSKESSEALMRQFFRENKYSSDKRAVTTCHLNHFRAWLKENNLSTSFEDEKVEWIDAHLRQFYIDVTAQSHYHVHAKACLFHFQLSMEKYLRWLSHGRVCMLVCPEFSSSRQVYDIVAKMESGHVVCNKLTAHFTEEDELRLKSSRILSDRSPQCLLWKVCFDITYHLCVHDYPTLFLYYLTKDDLKLSSDENGTYFTLKAKNWPVIKKTKRKMYAKPSCSDCPVRSTKLYLEKLSKIDALFQYPRKYWMKSADSWYHAMPIGRNKLKCFMPSISEQAGLSKMYSLESVILLSNKHRFLEQLESLNHSMT